MSVPYPCALLALDEPINDEYWNTVRKIIDDENVSVLQWKEGFEIVKNGFRVFFCQEAKAVFGEKDDLSWCRPFCLTKGCKFYPDFESMTCPNCQIGSQDSSVDIIYATPESQYISPVASQNTKKSAERSTSMPSTPARDENSDNQMMDIGTPVMDFDTQVLNIGAGFIDYANRVPDYDGQIPGTSRDFQCNLLASPSSTASSRNNLSHDFSPSVEHDTRVDEEVTAQQGSETTNPLVAMMPSSDEMSIYSLSEGIWVRPDDS